MLSLDSDQELPMPTWLIFQLFAMASMPAAYDMARDRGRSTKAWLSTALIFGPFALLALLERQYLTEVAFRKGTSLADLLAPVGMSHAG
jgi:hypothetical protein